MMELLDQGEDVDPMSVSMKEWYKLSFSAQLGRHKTEYEQKLVKAATEELAKIKQLRKPEEVKPKEEAREEPKEEATEEPNPAKVIEIYGEEPKEADTPKSFLDRLVEEGKLE